MKKIKKTQEKVKMTFFRDADGQLVLAQFPNLPLIGWGICTLLPYVFPGAHVTDGLKMLASGFLLIWAYLEITEGVTCFRKVLGCIVFLAVVVGYF